MRSFVACFLFFVLSACAASSPSCTGFSPGGQPPVLTNAKLANKTRLLCYSDFAVLHSGVTHGPLWSAEHLTRAHIRAARDGVRTDKFFAERSLPPGEGATLEDFRHSGYDRGHMSPAGDRWDERAMAESFSLANMVPQNPVNNRRVWSRIEEAVRRLASSSGEAYVVTGPLFGTREVKTIGPDGVFVPTQLYKVVYLPSRALAFAVVVDNIATEQYDMETVHQLERASGIRFPGIPESLKDTHPGGLNGV